MGKKTLNLDKEQLSFIIDSYYTKTGTELSIMFNCSISTIHKIWMENNLRGKYNRKYYCDFDYFNKIDSANKAYWLGLIASDGCIFSRDKHQSQVNLSLHSDDRYMLNNFLNDIKSNDIPKKVTSKNAYIASIVSDKLCTDLSKYNITPRKSWTYLTNNEIFENIYFNHYLRGYFDGDGCITRNLSKKVSPSYYSITIVGNEQFIVNLNENLYKRFSINSSVLMDKRTDKYTNDFYRLEFKNTTEKYCFLKFIYKNSTKEIRFERKYNLSNSLIDCIENNSSNRFENKKALIYYNELNNWCL